jgi:hypothetical protein
VKKFVFWNIIHNNLNIALTEDLSKYAQGDTFWQALQNLCETLKEWNPSSLTEESDINSRLKMYHETGINKIELFVEDEKKRYTVKCANSRSFLKAKSEEDALKKYVETRAKTSVVNTGEVLKV